MNIDRKTAPPVVYPITQPRHLPWLGVSLTLVMTLPLLAWYRVGGMPEAGFPVGVTLLWLVLSVTTCVHALRPQQGDLEWDGQAWHWHRVGGPSRRFDQSPAVLLDTQWLMGLRWQVSIWTRPTWLWVWRKAAPADWLALRRALFQRPRAVTAESVTGV